MQLISYTQASAHLEKRLGFDGQEMEVLARENPHKVFQSDLTNESIFYHRNKDIILNIYDHRYSFYDKEFIESWNEPGERIVYTRDLSYKRMWCGGDLLTIVEILKKAAEIGLLRWYVPKSLNYTSWVYDKKTVMGDILKSVPWAFTDEGTSYLNNIDSFYKLEDIVTIERVFFNKDKEICKRELGIK